MEPCEECSVGFIVRVSKIGDSNSKSCPTSSSPFRVCRYLRSWSAGCTLGVDWRHIGLDMRKSCHGVSIYRIQRHPEGNRNEENCKDSG